MRLKKLAITLMTTSLIMGINGIPAMAAENTVINENVSFENLNASSAVNALRQKQWTVDKEAVYETVHHEAEGYYEDKKVIDQEAVYEDVLVSPEEGHYEQELVKEAWTETINHPAEYKDVYVVDKEAWTETIEHPAEYQDVYIVDVPATTTKVQNGYICTGCWQVTGGIVGKG